MRAKKILVCIFLSFLVPTFLIAGTTGKIAGFVKDRDTGDFLPGVNVSIEGTTMGAATDLNGYFFIINVPPGNYRVSASMIGYKKLTMKDVRVTVDLTTKLNFELESGVLDLGKSVTVTAVRPLVDVDATTKRQSLTAAEIEAMPVINIKQIMTLSAGVMEMQGYNNKISGFDARGIDQVHVRGGRNAEVAYMIDGMIVEDPIYGGVGTTINRQAVDELTVITGAFDAQYGQANSAVINMVIKEGSQDYSGSAEYSTGELAGVLGSTSDDLRDHHDAIGSLSGPIPFINNMSFFVSGENYYKSYTVLEYDDIVYDPDNPDSLTEAYGAFRKAHKYDTYAGWNPYGFDKGGDVTAKLTWRITPDIKFVLTDRHTKRAFRNYSFSWQFAENGKNVNTTKTEQQGLIWTHQISPSTFYDIKFSRFWKHMTMRIHGKDGQILGRDEYTTMSATNSFYDNLYASSIDSTTGRWRYEGDTDRYWTRVYNQTMDISLDMTSQINQFHQIKTGIDYKWYDLFFFEEQLLHLSTPYREDYLNHPVEASFYIQDKMEYPNIVVNLGLRLDYANSKGESWDDPKDPTTALKTGKSKYQMSPRIGIGYPITDRATFHFSYGHFFQNPEYRNLYLNNERDLTTSRPLVGNPHLNAQKKVSYEIGVKQQLGDVWAVGITAWANEMAGNAGTIQIVGFDPEQLGLYNYYVFDNYDYGSARGIEVEVEKRYSKFFMGRLNYTYSVSKGNRYYSWTGYWDAQTAEAEPKKEFLMEYDQPHVLNLNADLRFPEDFGPSLLGFKPLSDFNLNLLFTANSGFPYTPTIQGVSQEPNTARRPWLFIFDVVIRKEFRAFGLRYGFFTRIFNLFDRKNPLTVYRETGSPTNPGPYASKTQTSTYYDRPHYYGPRRSIDLGFKIYF